VGVVAGLALLAACPLGAHAANGAYSDGTYGSCTYNSCGITLTSSGTLSLNVVPAGGTTCTVASDAVAVTTDSSTGYSLAMNDQSTSSSLVGTSTTIVTSGGTPSAPSALTANSWGWRVDGLSGFGAGPTTGSSNGGVPSLSFAGVPTSAQTSATVATSGSAADPAVTTPAWYGLCVTTSIPADSYSSTVVYTAVVN
jgi:hypothetical protein